MATGRPKVSQSVGQHSTVPVLISSALAAASVSSDSTQRQWC